MSNRRGGSPTPDPLVESPPIDLEGHAGVFMLLGELRGQVRELINTVNTTATKVDSIGTEVTKHSTLIETVKDHETRLVSLETDRSKREGALSLGGWLFKSPILGWLATAAAVIYALFDTKPHS